MDNFLDAGEVAEILKIGKDSVYKLAKEGAIPCVRLGETPRFNPAEIAQMGRVRQGKPADWEWSGSAVSHQCWPAYQIDDLRFRSLEDLVGWLEHMAQKNWVSKGDLVGIAQRFAERVQSGKQEEIPE